MTTDLKFPSNKNRELDFTPGFTAAEKKILARRPVVTDKKLRNAFILAVTLTALFFAGLFVERMVVDPLIHSINRAEAAEGVHQNDYYCNLIKEGTSRVVGAEGSLKELCAKHGVTL